MTPQALQTYLHQHIPLSQAMEVSVVEASALQVVLSAPLAPNINHRDTVFGGSASAVAILAAWSMLHLRLSAEELGSRLVIQRNTMDYLVPIDGCFPLWPRRQAQQCGSRSPACCSARGWAELRRQPCCIFRGGCGPVGGGVCCVWAGLRIAAADA